MMSWLAGGSQDGGGNGGGGGGVVVDGKVVCGQLILLHEGSN
jgi:hypothetical protein